MAIVLSAPAEVAPWTARVWTAEHGLPNNNVTGVAQSPDGYIWVGTHGGLVRFDGIQFKPITWPTHSIRQDVLIRALQSMDGDELWAAADGKVIVKYGEESARVFGRAEGIPDSRPRSLARDVAGAVWVGFADGSAARIFQNSVKRFYNVPGHGNCSVAADAAGQIWLTRGGWVGIYNTNQLITRYNIPETTVRVAPARSGGVWICAGPYLFKGQRDGPMARVGEIKTTHSEVTPTVLLEDQSGEVWIGTESDGLFHFNGTSVFRVQTSHRNILAIQQDREGSLWIGTGGGGLNRLRPQVLELQAVEADLSAEVIRSVCLDTTGTLWTVLQSGRLARRSTNEAWQVLTASQGWPEIQATCVTCDRGGGVWIGTKQKGLGHWQNNSFSFLQPGEAGLANGIVHALWVDRRGALWIGWDWPHCLQQWHQGQCSTFTPPKGSGPIRALAEDASGDLWAGTTGGALLRVHGDTLVDETSRTVSPRQSIRCLFAPTHGGVWIGYAGGGLGLLNQAGFKQLTTRNGLYDNKVCSVLSDGSGSLWLGSDHGIFQVSEHEMELFISGQAQTVSSISHGRDEMLPNLQASFDYSPAAWRGEDGRLWFSTLTGLLAVHPASAQGKRIPPLTQMDRVLVDGQSQKWSAAHPLQFLPRHHKIEFGVAILSFVAPENIQWQYRLEGLEADWVEGGSQRTVAYSQLAAGGYHFHFRACNSVGVWSPEHVLSFTVLPFYWQTWWFRLGAVILFTLIVAGWVRYVSFQRLRRQLHLLEQETALQRERQRIARDIHDELGASLTQIGMLADLGVDAPADNPQTREYLATIAARARRAVTALDEIVWSINPRNDSLPRLADYLCHMADDLLDGSPVHGRKIVPVGLPKIPVRAEVRHNLVLAVKEALNNSLKHAQAQTVWLRLKWEDSQLEIEVADDGHGFTPSAGPSLRNGLANQRARLKEIGGDLILQSEPGKGTCVRFRLKLTDHPVKG